jgi:hypothetical protein
MTLEEIKARIEKIKAISDDPEAAHSAEDDLYRDFIDHVAKRKDKIGEMAYYVLKSKQLDFPRYTA